MVLAPEEATSPVSQAPDDRKTLQVEQWAQQGLALLGADRVLDMDERRILRQFFQQLSILAQSGGLGNGAQPQGAPGMEPGMSPMEMNQNTQDVGTAEGATPEEEY
jgi:hypothetical protein